MATFSIQARLIHMDAYYAALQARLEREYLAQPNTTAGATAGGDERKLRGIPAIGRGVQGAIQGTRPDNITDENDA